MRKAAMMRRTGGFTLVELLVVIIIVTLMAGITVAMVSVFLQGQGVKQAGNLVSHTIAHAKQLAAEKRITCFVLFENSDQGARMRVYQDANMDRILQPTSDLVVPGDDVTLPSNVEFKVKPDWIAIEPSGYTTGYSDVSSGLFEGKIRSGVESGDIILGTRGQTHALCMDLDPAGGKIRKFHYLTGE